MQHFPGRLGNQYPYTDQNEYELSMANQVQMYGMIDEKDNKETFNFNSI